MSITILGLMAYDICKVLKQACIQQTLENDCVVLSFYAVCSADLYLFLYNIYLRFMCHYCCPCHIIHHIFIVTTKFYSFASVSTCYCSWKWGKNEKKNATDKLCPFLNVSLVYLLFFVVLSLFCFSSFFSLQLQLHREKII